MNHDPIDFEAQLLAEGTSLRRLARALVGGDDAADDLLQEASMKAWAARDRTASHLPQWLRVTMHNISRTWRRRDARRTRRERECASADVDESDPSTTAAAAELARDVTAAVHRLDEPFRTVVVLRYWHGLLPEAIAVRLGVPRNTVRSRLQRGLERLRQRLDEQNGDRTHWAAPLGVIAGVHWHAGTSAAVVTTTTGAMMKAKLVLVAAGLAAVAAVVMAWPDAPDPAQIEVAAHTVAPVAAEVAVPHGPAAAIEREAVPATSPEQDATPIVEPDPAPEQATRVDPWPLRVLVIDEQDTPVVDAEVTVWPMVPATPLHLQDKVSAAFSGRAPQPLPVAHTDSSGRATVLVAAEACEVEARQRDVGASDPMLFGRDQAVDGEQRLRLLALRFLLGRVLHEDGTPAIGAKVDARVSVTSNRVSQTNPDVEPATTDAHGVFRFRVHDDCVYTLHAELEGRRTFEQELWIDAKPLPEVTLTFPGAITIAGLVVDPDGVPLANAEVTAWRVLADGPEDDPDGEPDVRTVRSDSAGWFRIDVQRFDAYDVLAQADGLATSALVRVAPNVARPHAEVRLGLSRFVLIRGRVLHADGSPFANVQVAATPETGLDLGRVVPKSAVPTQRDLFPQVDAAHTAADGSFVLGKVHPGTTWTLTVRLEPTNSRHSVAFTGIAPGSDDVDLRVTDAAAAGCIVRGTVRAAGRPVDGLEVTVYDYRDGHIASPSPAGASWHGDTFVCAPLGLDRQFCLRVAFPDEHAMARVFAPAFVGPFRTDRAQLDLTVDLVEYATLPVRVRQLGGAPVRVRRLIANRLWAGPYMESEALQIDETADEVVVELKELVPGRNLVLLFDAAGAQFEQTVTVRPGANPELLMELPAK